MVTGAAQGIGREIATRLIAAGARVHVADIDVDGMAPVGEAGAMPHHLDLADRKSCFDLIRRIVAAEGKIDILVNAAGGSLGKGRSPLEDIPESDWHDIFNANANGAFRLCQAIAPHMKSAGYGRIVNIASNAGLRPALSGNIPYSSAKHALVGMTRQMAVELGPCGVTVNAVAPSFVMSGPWARRLWDGYDPQARQRLIESIHTRRLGTAPASSPIRRGSRDRTSDCAFQGRRLSPPCLRARQSR